MKATRWSADVPYKSMQSTVQVNGGLNEVQSASLIGDSQASELINFDTLGDDELVSVEANGSDFEFPLGALEFISAVKTDTVNNVFTLTGVYGVPDTANKIYYGATTVDVSADAFQLDKVHVVIFNQAETQYYIVQSILETRILIFNATLGTVAYGTLPDAYARCIEVFVNRVFIITGTNKMWWTKAGTTGSATTDWYGGSAGETSTENYVTKDSGYWILESESILYHIAKFNSNLLIFSAENIYAFSGYSPETFSLSKLCSGVGASNDEAFSHPTFSNDRMFFLYGKYVYELTSGYMPNIINAPIISGGEITNGMRGGFNGEIFRGLYVDFGLQANSKWGITSDDEYVYVYNSALFISDIGKNTSRIYRYDIRRRKWTKLSGFTISTDVTYEYTQIVVPSNHPLVWFRQNVTAGTNVAMVFYDVPEISSEQTYISKAFTVGAFGTNVMNALWFQRNVPVISDISVYVSKSEVGDDDWVEIWRFENDTTGNKILSERITVPHALATLSQFHRVKITSSGGQIKIYPYTKEVRSNVRS